MRRMEVSARSNSRYYTISCVGVPPCGLYCGSESGTTIIQIIYLFTIEPRGSVMMAKWLHTHLFEGQCVVELNHW